MKSLATTLLAVAAAATALPAGAERQTEEFQWRGRLAAGQAIEIKGVNGDVDAAPASGDEVEVSAVKSARRSDPAQVKIEVLPHAGGVTVCVVYPAVSGKANECAPGEGGRMNSSNNDVAVRFSVRVPRGVRFVGRTVNGDVSAEALEEDVEAYTVNGGVRVATRGNARAQTVNGSITAALGRADWRGSVSFETVNGGITLELPDDLNADVKGETVNGSIETDFPLAVKGKFSSRRLSGTIGSGGRELRLETVNGSIRLKKAS
jgi:Putative adhesin